ncbi:MAG: ATP-binding protein [Stellaceae bacterium]
MAAASVAPRRGRQVQSGVRRGGEPREGHRRGIQNLTLLGKLTAEVAHDFSNALTTIIGNLDLILSDRRTSAAVLGRARHAIQAAELGAHISAKLLNIARGQKPVRRCVRADEVLGDLLPFVAGTLGVEIAVACDADLWHSDFDRRQFEAAIVNLLVNARDAMPNGGRVNVAARNRTLSPEMARPFALRPGDYVQVAVEDTGTGISAELLPRIQEPFFTTKLATGGTGLGLSLVRDFAKDVGGALSIDSRHGRGTTVHLLLPRSVPASSGGATHGAMEAQG